MTRSEFLQNQKEYCEKKQAPFFMPESGSCWSCHNDIIQPLIDKGKDGTELVTGCPLCHRSYCD